MTLVYTFVRFLYSKDLIYLSYSLVQTFSLIFILTYSKLFSLNPIYQDISSVIASLFAIVFSLAYSKGNIFPYVKTQKELFIYTALVVLILSSSFYHYILFEYLPYTIIYFLLSITLVFNKKENFYAKAIYVIGWSIVCLFFYISNIKYLYIQSTYIDLVLIAFVIEALFFTIAISYSYKNLLHENEEYEKQLLYKTKLANTGEMIGNITHQFRQPLNNISYILMNVKKAFYKGKLDELYIEKKFKQVNTQVEYLSKTIKDFKEFYSPDKHICDFSLKESILRAMSVISSDLKKNEIEISLIYEVNEDLEIYGISNELSQVILILLSNAKDALCDIQNPEIKIEVKSLGAEVEIYIIDNANGIKNMNKIFQAYYSSKQDGFGIGLHLAKHIIEETFKGKIKARNLEDNKGAVFTLILAK